MTKLIFKDIKYRTMYEIDFYVRQRIHSQFTDDINYNHDTFMEVYLMKDHLSWQTNFLFDYFKFFRERNNYV
jgi:hypothetical protein